MQLLIGLTIGILVGYHQPDVVLDVYVFMRGLISDNIS